MFNYKKLTFYTLASALMLSACSTKQEIYTGPQAQEDKPVQQNNIKAQIKEQAPRETVVYEPESPEIYTVQKGDTLWDISSHFLRDPWLWPEIWYKNPQIDNPHLIYPGDQLAIVYVGGQKRIQLIKRGETFEQTKGLKIVKISPRVRSNPLSSSIPSIPIDSIRQLLDKPLVIDEEELANSAYVLASKDQHLANSSDDIIYVRGIDPNTPQGKYSIFRPNKPIRDIITDEVYGYESLYLGEAKILKHGDPAVLRIISSSREILRDDRLIPLNNSDIERDFFPKTANDDIDGRVISLVDGISRVGQYNTVAINLGVRDGVNVGDLVRINQAGKVVKDFNEEDPDFLIKLPEERAGIALIIKSYEKMSYCLILEAELPVRPGDLVVSP